MPKKSEELYIPQAHELELLQALAREAKRELPPWEPPCLIERPAEKCSHGVWLGAENSHVYCGFANYSCAPFDSAEYDRWKQIVREHQRIEERREHHCGTCEQKIPVHLVFCKDCAPNALVDPPTAPVEVFNTIGSAARFYESKARPLSERSAVDFETVQVFARTILCDVLSEVMGLQINALAEIMDDPRDKLFRAFGEESPSVLRMMKRFYLWTHGTPIEEIAAIEGTTRKGIENYIARWIESIESVVGLLGSPPLSGKA